MQPLAAMPRSHRNAGTRCARVALGLVAVLLVWSIEPPTRALAWTRAQVRGAQAHVDVLDTETAVIALRLRVQITGGWLSELELPGLPATIDFTADKPATLVADTGEKYVPDMVLRRGVWRLTFASKHQAPWRGDYTLNLLYRQALELDPAGDAGMQRARWTMPPWRMGIEDARIWISGPTGMLSASHDDQGHATSHNTQHLRGRVLITQHRTHLPRDTEWAVVFDLPMSAGKMAAPATKQSNAPSAASIDGMNQLTQRSTGRWLPWLALLFALLKVMSTRTMAAKHHATARPLFPSRSIGLRGLLAVGLAAGAHGLWTTQPWLASTLIAVVVLLAINRSFSWPAAASLRWAPADSSVASPRLSTRLRTSLAPHRWMDVTTPVGSVVLAAISWSLWWVSRWLPVQGPALTLLGVLVAPLWVTATRLHLPWQGAQIAASLQRWCAKHQALLEQHDVRPAVALVCVDDQGRDRDARLPLHLDRALDGLHSMDLSMITDARSLRRGVAMLVQAEVASAADVALQMLPRSARRLHNTTAVHVIPTQYIVAALAALRSSAGVIADADPAASVPDRAAA